MLSRFPCNMLWYYNNNIPTYYHCWWYMVTVVPYWTLSHCWFTWGLLFAWFTNDTNAPICIFIGEISIVGEFLVKWSGISNHMLMVKSNGFFLFIFIGKCSTIGIYSITSNHMDPKFGFCRTKKFCRSTHIPPHLVVAPIIGTTC
jgi:hypothetical protein